MTRSYSQIGVEEGRPFLSESEYDLEQYERRHKTRKRLYLCLAVFVTAVLLAGIIVAFVIISNEKENGPARLPAASFKHAVVAADAAQCSEIGKNILLKGGNGVDSAIATLLCNGITDAQSTGIGGGFFMTIYDSKTGLSTVIDARETAPSKATEDMFVNNPGASSEGPLSIAVPAEVKGHWYAHQKYGKLPWKELFEPAINMAAEGFPVPIGLDKAIQDARELLTKEPTLREVFVNKETGELYREGEIMKRPQLAKTLQAIADEGPDAFYNGSLTDDIMADLKELGAIITREDLLNYKVLEKEPIAVTLKNGVKVISPPPPGSGPVLSFILNIMDGYNPTASDIADEKSRVLTYHRIIEAFKFAYAKRTQLGDEDFIDTKELVKNLTSTEYADSIRKLITDDATHNFMYYGPTYSNRKTSGTCHLSVLDQNGMGVAVTSTINGRFGCKSRGVRTGIIWNNEMDDFSSPNVTNKWGLRPSPANFIKPGKRPLSSMVPMVAVNPDGSVSKVIGGAGGSKITTSVAWVTMHNMWYGDNIREAITRLRLHHQLLPPTIQYEAGFTESTLSQLHQLGHNTTSFKVGSSIVQGIDVRDGTIFANSDYRKGGVPDGF